MSVEEKLKEAQELAVEPIDLSEPEKERLTQIIELIKEGLDRVLEEALSKSREEAFEIIKGYLIAMRQGGAVRPDSIDEVISETPVSEKRPPAEPIVHPRLEDIFAGLPEDMCAKARGLLSCVKSYVRLEAEGEDGSQVLCPNCNPGKMIECIRVEDPTVVDEMDEELRKVGVVR